MKIKFRKKRLEDLYVELKGSEDYSNGVAKGFVKRVNFIKAAADVGDLRKIKGLRFEKLKGKLNKYHGIRINDQYRIILTRSEEHTSELQSHSFISYAVFCLKKKKK